MKIAGFKKQSLIDYPGNISSVIFTQGCNFLCEYCHNPNLVLPEKFEEAYDTDTVLFYLEEHKHLLDAVCITGGEPCIYKSLPDFIEKIKKIGLKVKLDTNGTAPEMLKHLLIRDHLDFIAMDIKHVLSFEKYKSITGGKLSMSDFNRILKSVVMIKDSGLPYQFRTTVAKGLHTIKDIDNLKRQFQDNLVLQNLNPDVMINQNPEFCPFSKDEFGAIVCDIKN